MSITPVNSDQKIDKFVKTGKRRFFSWIVIVIAGLLRQILRLLPHRPIFAVMRFIGRHSPAFCPREREVAEAQIRVALGFELGSKENRRIVSGAFEHVALSFAETLIIDLLTRPTGELAPDGFPLLERIDMDGDPAGFVRTAASRGKGVLALSGHIGPFEILSAAQGRFGTKIAAVGRLPNYEGLAKYATQLRHGYNTETIWREDPTSAKKLRKQLRSGGIIALLIDQDVDIESEFAPFFGIEAGHPIALVGLAVRLCIPIIGTFITREPNGRYTIRDRNFTYDPEDPAATLQILQQYNTCLEELIRRYPEQWLWWHRRWRRRPGNDYKTYPDTLPSRTGYIDWLNSLPAGSSPLQTEPR